MRLNLLVPIVIAALLALMGSVYVVAEGQTAIVLNLGRVVRTDIGPGLHFKWPLVEKRAACSTAACWCSMPSRSAT